MDELALVSGPEFWSLLEDRYLGRHANYGMTGLCVVSLREGHAWGTWKVVFTGLPQFLCGVIPVTPSPKGKEKPT